MALRRYQLRLSPSDQFVKDDEMGMALPQGPGTPGVGVFAEVGADVPMTAASVLVPFLVNLSAPITTIPFILKKSYVYEIMFDVLATASVAAPGGSWAVEVSAADIVTGVRAPLLSSSYAVPAASAARSWCMRSARVAVSGIGWAHDQHDIQVTCNAAATMTLQRDGSALTIISYVP